MKQTAKSVLLILSFTLFGTALCVVRGGRKKW